MVSPGFPALSLTLVQSQPFTVRSQILYLELRFEDEDAYLHHLTLDALEKPGNSCTMCAPAK